MNKYKKLTINIIVLTFIFTGGLTNTAFASPAIETKDNAREIAILESFEDQDYASWKKYIGENSNLATFLDKDKFDKFIKIRELARSGQYDAALELSERFEQELKSCLLSSDNKKVFQPELLPEYSKLSKAKLAIDRIKDVKIEAERNIS